MITCPNCGREHEDTVKICDYCGAPLSLEATATHVFDDTDFEDGRPQWGTARFNPRNRLIVSERDSKDQHIFYFDDFDEIVVGRIDPDTGDMPDIDLTPYQAADKGVSRRHAKIIRRDMTLNIADMGSPNGTFLNGQRLVSSQPRVLRDGDEVRLGYLVLRVTFDRA